MKLLRYTYIIALATIAICLAACSADSENAGEGQQGADKDGKVQVRLHISPAGPSVSSTRADANAIDGEMMNIWTVYCVDNDPTSARYGKLVFIHICMPDGNKETDDLVYLPKGKYAFYSFANIHPIEANGLMGISYDPKKLTPVKSDGTPAGPGDEVDFYYGYYPDPNDPNNTIYRDFFEISANNPHKGVVYNMKWADEPTSDTYVFKYHEISGSSDIGMYSKTVDGMTGFWGNGLELSEANCFNSRGIPMSNYQEINITDETNVDLIVVRMVAKIEVQLFNESSTPVTVKSATLSDITQDGPSVIGVFPNLNNKGTGMENQMTYEHKDIKPHLAANAAVDGYTYKPSTAVTVPANYDYATNKSNPAHKMVFYVNESATPKNASGLFFLSLGLDKGGGKAEYRHALINQKGSTTIDDDAWDYIARNDYRIIPIILTDWQFRVEPLAYPPIAGYPAGTLSSDALTATFNTGGPIILYPYVKKKGDTDWRDFFDPEVELVSLSWKNDDGDSKAWKNSDGTVKDGPGKIIETAFTYDPDTKSIIGVLNNNLAPGTYKTAITVTVKLGPTGSQYNYSFTCNVVLQVS